MSIRLYISLVYLYKVFGRLFVQFMSLVYIKKFFIFFREFKVKSFKVKVKISSAGLAAPVYVATLLTLPRPSSLIKI